MYYQWVLKIFQAVIILFLLLPFVAYAEENCQWKDVVGEAMAETITVEDAGKLALRRARISATEQVAGVGVYGGSLVKNSALVEDFVMTLTEGYILREEIQKWDAEFQQPSKDKPPVPLYRVYARCCVSLEKGEKDPFFTVSLETNKPVYISDEEATVRIRPGRGAYLAVFHLSHDEKLRILLPNQFQKRQYVEEGKELVFPSQGLGLKVKTSHGNKREVEYFVAVATKEWFDFEGQFKKDRDISLSSFYSALLSIPANMRTVAIGGYEVVAAGFSLR